MSSVSEPNERESNDASKTNGDENEQLALPRARRPRARFKGLVLVRELRQRDSGDGEKLELYNAEIQRVRDRLANVVMDEFATGRPAA
jgi:hypothetical protein